MCINNYGENNKIHHKHMFQLYAFVEIIFNFKKFKTVCDYCVDWQKNFGCKKWPDEIWGNTLVLCVILPTYNFALDNLPELWHLPGHWLSECCQVSTNFPEELRESQFKLQRSTEQRFWKGNNLLDWYLSWTILSSILPSLFQYSYNWLT